MRRSAPRQTVVTYAGIVLDVGRHEVRIAGAPVAVTRKEYELLKLLLRHAGQVVSREEILTSVWGADYIGETRTLDIHMATLRKHIAGSGAEITTVRGVGYLLQ